MVILFFKFEHLESSYSSSVFEFEYLEQPYTLVTTDHVLNNRFFYRAMRIHSADYAVRLSSAGADPRGTQGRVPSAPKPQVFLSASLYFSKRGAY